MTHSKAEVSTTWLDDKMAKSAVFHLTDISQNRSLGYPHTNAFAAGDRYMVIGASNEDETTALWRLDLHTGEERKLSEAKTREKSGYYDVASEAAVLVTVTALAIHLYNLDDGTLMATHCPPLGAGYTLDDLPSITADGREVVVGFSRNGWWGGYHLDVTSGKGRVLFEKPWFANHFHFSPHDKNWIAFSHEGRADEVTDRMWAWHATLAPEGRCVFDQSTNEAGRYLQIGHERWCFHDTSAVVVAYGGNPTAERGVYEAYADGRAGRQIYQGSALHVNTSVDGRWLVIDTLGPYDTAYWKEGPPPGPWPWALLSDIVVIDRQTNARAFVAHSLIGNRHPGHPHPAFSSDGRYIFYNEVEPDAQRKRCRVICARNPLWGAPAFA